MSQIPNHKPAVSLRGQSPKQSTRGETILEVLIAISVFTIIIVPASGLYISSVRNSAVNRNDLIAAALADEGIEVVRGIRDTNFLKFSPKAGSCWNTVPGDAAYTPILGDCDTLPAHKIGSELMAGPVHFVLQFDPNTLAWNLFGTTDVLDLETADLQDETFRLRLDSATETDPECGAAPGTPPGCHTHRNIYFSANADALAADPSLAGRGAETSFYRQILIEYFDIDMATPQPEAMRVTSLVQYRAGTRVQSVRRSSVLTNYPGK